MADRIKAGNYSMTYLNNIKLFLVESEKMKNTMESLGFNNVIFLPNFKSINFATDKINKLEGCVSFLFLSRIMPEKGCRYIISAVKDIVELRSTNAFRVDFYGQIEPSFSKEFQEACDTISNINYCGQLNLFDEENYKLLSRYHYMLFPTYWMGEGFPGVIIDAYKSGIPVIASDWNFNTEFIHNGYTGFIINPHSVEDLKNLMLRCIDGITNYSSMVENCLVESKKYDTDVVINGELLKELLP